MELVWRGIRGIGTDVLRSSICPGELIVSFTDMYGYREAKWN